MMAKLIFELGLFSAYMASLVFFPAGTVAYPGAWVLLALVIGGGILITAWLYHHDPALLRERLGSPLQRGQETWDRVFLFGLMVFFTAWIAFSAWDAARRGFAAVPRWAQAFGAVSVTIYMLGAWLTFRENRFAVPVVKLQEGQKVVDTGLYAIVRHPLYASALFLFLGVPLLLGSWWGLTGSALLIGGVGWRAVNEERVLRSELPGYDAYARRVRYRFIPGVW